MDKLKRVLSGNDDTSDENRGIMGDVGVIILTKKCLLVFFSTYLTQIMDILYLKTKLLQLIMRMSKVSKNDCITRGGLNVLLCL